MMSVIQLVPWSRRGPAIISRAPLWQPGLHGPYGPIFAYRQAHCCVSGRRCPLRPEFNSRSPCYPKYAIRFASASSRPLVDSRKVFLALGSNQGDRLRNIEKACDLITSHPSMRLVRTSSLYESTPMYYKDQARFYNAACEIETTLGPIELLDELQAIERDLGRVKTIDKGPRNIDLDILLFEHETIDTERLVIPHRLMHEREFVLRPLADIAPNARIRSISSSQTIASHLQDLRTTDPSLTPLVPYGPGLFLRPQDPHKSTKLMAVLNVTPDSFSDGGRHYKAPSQGTQTNAVDSAGGAFQSLEQTIAQQSSDGADIVDVGGQSSRPYAPDVGADEEMARLRPALTIFHDAFKDLPVSIDTYRSQIVKRVFEAPAEPKTHAASPPGTVHIVNDISAGLLDPDLLRQVADPAHRSTIVLSHIRGTPETMTSAENLKYENGVVEGVATELLKRVRAAEEAGIRRWRIILDPGIGFAKNTAHNLELLRGLPRLRAWPGLQGMPWLIGTSRKRFIGEVLGQKEVERSTTSAMDVERHRKVEGIRDVEDREWGTAATVVAAIQGGADIVRVHEVAGMADVIKVADAIYRA